MRPRAFRLPVDEAVIINYGVPSDGADVVARRVACADSLVPFGVNIVETNSGRETTPAAIIAEMTEAVATFAPLVRFLASARSARTHRAHIPS